MYEAIGLKELKAALGNMDLKSSLPLQNAANKAGKIVLAAAIRKAPGNIKNGLELENAETFRNVIFSEIKIKKGYGYAVFVELGHQLFAWGRRTNRHIEGKMFLREAADENEKEIENLIAQGLDEVLEEFGK